MKYDYDVVIIGGGAAGLVAATGASGLGAKALLIEKNKLGGDCTWYGCIPSKTLLKSAQVFSLLKRLREFGIAGPEGAKYDAAGVMEHVRRITNKVSQHHPAQLFEKRGVKVLFGDARFIDNKHIQLDARRFSAKHFIIATGSHPLIPAIDGLKGIPYLTNENVFDLETLPKSLIVLGAGPIGIELAQAFSRLGAEVSVVEMSERILFREDKEISAILAERLAKEGIKLYLGKKAVKFSQEGAVTALTLEGGNKEQVVIKAEKVLVAAGRSANVSGLDLEKAGIKYSSKGIVVNNTLRATAKNIYGCGDVCGPYQFSHMAEYQAVIAVGNALLPFKRKADYSCVPWCTFTDPEAARVGLTEEEARALYKNVKIYTADYSANDRAVTDMEESGRAKVICDRQGFILGAHIAGACAGEIIHEYVLAKRTRLKVSSLSGTIHIYPTLAQLIKRTGDQYYLQMLNSRWVKFLTRLCLNINRC